MNWREVSRAAALVLGCLLVVGTLMHWSYMLGRSELYGTTMALRFEADSVVKICHALRGDSL